MEFALDDRQEAAPTSKVFHVEHSRLRVRNIQSKRSRYESPDSDLKHRSRGHSGGAEARCLFKVHQERTDPVINTPATLAPFTAYDNLTRFRMFHVEQSPVERSDFDPCKFLFSKEDVLVLILHRNQSLQYALLRTILRVSPALRKIKWDALSRLPTRRAA